MLTHTALTVDAAGAVAWAADHPGWYIFPGALIADEVSETWIKRPLVSWTSRASKDPAEITTMWNEVGGSAVVCVACAPSGIWVLDQDSDLDPEEHDSWIGILDTIEKTKGTLVLRSCTKGRPHYVFRQGEEWVAEGKWVAGDVKASGMIVISAAPPLVDAPTAVAPEALLNRLRIGRPKGSRGRGVASSEVLSDWLLSTPDIEDLILDAKGAEHFLGVIVDHMFDQVDGGMHRRQACLNAVFQSAIEACAGCYTAEAAYEAVREAYRTLRESRGEVGEKGWSASRRRDYDMMWASLVPAIEAGDYDDKIAETRAAAVERYGGDADDLRWFIESILGGPTTSPAPAVPGGSEPIPLTEPDGSSPSFEDAVAALAEGLASSPPPGIDPATGEVLGGATGAPPAPAGLEWGPSATAAPGPPPKRSEPVLDEAALWGPHGDLIEALRGLHESADVGVLGALIAYAGAVLAGRAHFRIGVDVHGPNDYVLNIGASSAARKSSALNLVERGVFFDAERIAAEGPLVAAMMPRRVSGVASGERLIHVWTPTKDGEVEIWPERRVVIIESEASAMWKRAKRDGAVLSDVVCKMWDQADLANHAITSGSVSVPADKHLASFIGASTTHVAIETMRSKDGTDAKSGFANRFLWLYLPDSGVDLPFGALLPVKAIRTYQDRLGIFDALTTSGFGVEAAFSDGAKTLWAKEYGRVKRDKGAAGFIEAMCSRGESHVLRLALNYWLAAGGDPLKVGEPALRAALAVWRYAKESVEFIFGDATGDRSVDDLVAELEIRGGWATMEELRVDLNKNTLAGLVARGMESGVMVSGKVRGGPGRPAGAVALTRWLKEGTLIPLSVAGRVSRPTPLSAVIWDTKEIEDE